MLLKFSDISGNDGLLGTNNSDTPFVTCQSTCMCKRHRQYQWLICTESLLCARKLFIPCNNMLRQVLLFSSFYASGNWGSETWSNLPRVTEQGSAPKPDRRQCLDVIPSTPWCFVGSELDASGPNEGPDQLGRPVSTCFPRPWGPQAHREISQMTCLYSLETDDRGSC